MKFCPTELAALCVGLALVCFPDKPQARTSASQDWTASRFVTAFEDFFPIRQAEGDFIAVRAHQNGTNEAREFSFIIANTQDPKAMRATLHQAEGTSLYRQLAALHSKDSSKSYGDLKPELKVQTWNFTAQQCPAAKAQYKAFENIQFVRPRDEDEPEEHPMVYEINETVAGSSSQVIEFMPKRAIPLWAEATRKALLICAGAVPGGNSGNDPKVEGLRYCEQPAEPCYTFRPVLRGRFRAAGERAVPSAPEGALGVNGRRQPA